MKKLTPIILLVVAIVSLGIWIMNRDGDHGGMDVMDETAYAFAIEDTSAVDRIVIKDKVPQEVDLIKVDGRWTLNGRGIRKDAIEVLMETLRRMQMRNFVPENSQEEIIRRMSTYGKEVIVYSDDDEVAHFYVGTDTPDQLATYMLNDGASRPFAVHIPGFNGYLSSRFITKEVLWYSRELINADVFKLQGIEINSNNNKYPSLSLVNADGDWTAKDVATGNDAKIDTKVVSAYLQQLQLSKYEGAILESDPIFSRKDSLLSYPPFWQLTWTDSQGENHWLRAFRIKPVEGGADAQGVPLEYDPDRMHGIYDDGRMVLLQFFGLRYVMGGPETLSIVVE